MIWLLCPVIRHSTSLPEQKDINDMTPLSFDVQCNNATKGAGIMRTHMCQNKAVLSKHWVTYYSEALTKVAWLEKTEQRNKTDVVQCSNVWRTWVWKKHESPLISKLCAFCLLLLLVASCHMRLHSPTLSPGHNLRKGNREYTPGAKFLCVCVSVC